MTGTAIPELVARLRELHNARRYPTEMLVATIRDDQSAQVYATSTGPMRVVRPVAETTVDHADLIAETLNALPTLLDALERQPSRDSGGVEGAPFDTDGLEWIERLDGSLDLFRAGSGANLATVYTNGTWFTWDANGTGGENDKAPDVEAAKAQAIKALVRQHARPVSGWARHGAHSPDSGKVELNHDRCGSSTGIDGRLTAGQGELDEYGQWSIPCDQCLARVATGYAAALEERIAHLESLTTWRPISEPPSAEVHAWCGGRYLVDLGTYVPWAIHCRDLSAWATSLNHADKRYIPIPPTDESEDQ